MAQNIEINILANIENASKSIQAFASSANQSLKQIEQTNKSLVSSTDNLAKSFSGIGSTIKELGAVIGITFGARAVFNFFTDSVQKAAEFESSLTGIISVANKFGISTDTITKRVQDLASDGLVPLQNIAASLKNLLSSGLGLEESTKLFLALKDAAAFNRQGFLSLGQAIEGASQGIKNQQSILVDNAGITKNLSILEKEYAASIGTTIGRLTEAQKRQAIYVGILKEAAIFTGDAAKLSETYAGSTVKLSFAFDKLQVAIGKIVTESPRLVAFLESLAGFITQASDSVGPAASEFSDFLKGLTKLGVGLKDIFITLNEAVLLGVGSIAALPALLLGAEDSVFSFGKAVHAAFDIVRAATSQGFEFKAVVKNTAGVLESQASEIGKASDKYVESFLQPLRKAFGDNREFEPFVLTVKEATKAISKGLSDIDLGALAKLKTDLNKTNLDTLDDLKKFRDERLALISRASLIEGANEQELSELKTRVIKDFYDKSRKLADKNVSDLKKTQEEMARILETKLIPEGGFNLVELPKLEEGLLRISRLFNANLITDKTAKDVRKKLTDAAVGFVKDVGGYGKALTGGAEGALKSLADGLGNIFGPEGKIFAEAAKQIIDIFGAAPAEFVQNITNTITGIGPLLSNILINVANLFSGKVVTGIVKGLIDSLPSVVQALAYSLSTQLSSPVFWVDVGIAFVTGIVKAIPLMVQGFIDGLKQGFGEAFAALGQDIKKIPEKLFDGISSAFKDFGEKFLDLPKQFFEKIQDLFSNFNPINLLSKLFKIDLGPAGPVEKFIGLNFPFVEFAKGGMVGGSAKVPGDSRLNDFIPALLSPGEAVIPRSVISSGVGGIINFVKDLGIPVPGFFSFKGFAGSIGSSIGDFFNDAVDAISGVGSKAQASLSDTIRGVFGPSIANTFDELFGLAGFNNQYEEIIRSLIKIGAKFNPVSLIQNPKKEIFNALDSVRGFLTEPLKKALVKPTGLATGGMIPSGFNNDSFLTGLSSGEFVVNNSLTPKLESFLDGNQDSEIEKKLDINNALLGKLLTLLGTPFDVSTNIVIGQEEIANVILKLNRSNQRLA